MKNYVSLSKKLIEGIEEDLRFKEQLEMTGYTREELEQEKLEIEKRYGETLWGCWDPLDLL